MITHTISAPELIWTVSCCIGLTFNVRVLRRAVGDYQIVRRRKINSIREYAAMTTLYTFATWVIVQFLFVMLGIVAMTSPNTNHTVSPVQYSLLAGFVMVSIILAVSGYLVDVRRSTLIKKIAQFEE